MCRGKTAFIIIHRNPAVVKKNFFVFFRKAGRRIADCFFPDNVI